MKVKYEKPKGSRIKKGSIKYKGKRIDNFISLKCSGYVWIPKENRYAKYDEPLDENLTSDFYIYSIKNLKSAIRHIKKHDEVPKGTIFILYSNFKGYNIYIRK